MLELPTAQSPLHGLGIGSAFAVMNAGLLGYPFDHRYSLPGTASPARFGRLAVSGALRDWKDGERSTAARVAPSTLGSGFDGLASYYRALLFLDTEVAGTGNSAPVASSRVAHVFETDESHGGVLRLAIAWSACRGSGASLT